MDNNTYSNIDFLNILSDNSTSPYSWMIEGYETLTEDMAQGIVNDAIEVAFANYDIDIDELTEEQLEEIEIEKSHALAYIISACEEVSDVVADIQNYAIVSAVKGTRMLTVHRVVGTDNYYFAYGEVGLPADFTELVAPENLISELIAFADLSEYSLYDY